MTAEQHRNAKRPDPRGARLKAQRIKRTVRFSDPEWKQVRESAESLGITPSEYVRNAALNAIHGGVSRGENAGISPALVEIIRLTHRSAYILSTLKRDEMIRDGRAREMDEMVRAARNAQEDIFISQSSRHEEPDY